MDDIEIQKEAEIDAERKDSIEDLVESCLRKRPWSRWDQDLRFLSTNELDDLDIDRHDI